MTTRYCKTHQVVYHDTCPACDQGLPGGHDDKSVRPEPDELTRKVAAKGGDDPYAIAQRDVEWTALHNATADFLKGYTFTDGESFDYELTEEDRAMVEDFIAGLHADDDYLKAIAQVYPVRTQQRGDHKALHDAVLRVVESLATKDPAADSPEGKVLIALAGAVERFEKSIPSARSSTAALTGDTPRTDEAMRGPGFSTRIVALAKQLELERAYYLAAYEKVSATQSATGTTNWQARCEWLLRHLEEADLFKIVPQAVDADGIFTLERIAEVIDIDLNGPSAPTDGRTAT